MADTDGTEKRRIDVVGDTRELARRELLGAEDWKRSKVGWVIGAAAFGRALRAGVGFIGQPAVATWRAGRGFFSHWKAEPLPTASTDPSARFEAAREMYGRDEADLRMDTNTTSKWQSIFLVLTALVLSYGVASLGSLGQNALPGWLDFVQRFSLLAPLLALSAQMGFQNWQLRTRRLGSFREWLSSPREWLAETVEESTGRPGGKGMSGMASFLLIAGTAGMGAWLGMSPAEAQSTPSQGISDILQTPGDTDLWKAMLQYVFPHVGPWANSGGAVPNGILGLESSWRVPQANAINSAMSVFLAVLMAFASMGLAYFTLVGTISTAHEGKVMGQRWHTFYAPVRVVSGFGMLVPVFNGFCMAQVIVIYLAVWGGSFGNLIWSGYISGMSDRTALARVEPQTLNVLQQMTMMEVCAAATRSAQGNISQFTQGISQLGRTDARGDNLSWTEEVQRGGPRAGSGPLAANGMSTALSNSRQAVTLRTFRLSYGACGEIVLPNSVVSGNNDAVAYETALRDAILTYQRAIRPEAEKLVANLNPAQNRNNVQPADSNALRSAAGAFGTALGTATDNLRNAASTNRGGSGIDAIKNAMRSAGWAASGAFYMAISNYHEGFVVTATRIPTVTQGVLMRRYTDDSRQDNPFRGLSQSTTAWWNGALSNMPNLAPAVVELARMGAGDPVSGVANDPLSSLLGGWMLRNAMANLQVDLTKSSGLDHMVGFGHSLLAAWLVIVGILLFLGGVSNMGMFGRLVSGVGGFAAGGGVGAFLGGMVNTLFQYLGGILQLLMLAILAVGVVHAYVLPMIPYIIMFFFIVGMLILVVEGMVAAPLWALFHVRPDGQEFVEQVQRPGYMILFNLILRIPLAMFGMMFSFLMIDAIMWFESVTFIPAFLGATTDDNRGYGLFGIIAAILMLGFLHWQACLKSFGLITHLPDQVSRWFGQAGERLGEDQDTKMLIGGMVQRSERQLQDVAGGGMVRAAGRRADGQPKEGAEGAKDNNPNAGTAAGGTRAVNNRPAAAPRTEGGGRTG